MSPTAGNVVASICIDATGPGIPFAVNEAGDPASPVAVAVSVFVPAVALSVQLPTVAMPLLPEVAIPPVIAPPPPATPKVTVTPATPFPWESVIFTEGATGTELPATPLWSLPALTAIVLATAGLGGLIGLIGLGGLVVSPPPATVDGQGKSKRASWPKLKQDHVIDSVAPRHRIDGHQVGSVARAVLTEQCNARPVAPSSGCRSHVSAASRSVPTSSDQMGIISVGFVRYVFHEERLRLNSDLGNTPGATDVEENVGAD